MSTDLLEDIGTDFGGNGTNIICDQINKLLNKETSASYSTNEHVRICSFDIIMPEFKLERNNC